MNPQWMAQAQFLYFGTKAPGYKHRERPLLVVSSGEDARDKRVKEIFDEYWTFSTATLIRANELTKYNTHDTYNYIMPYSIMGGSNFYNKETRESISLHYYGYFSTIKDPEQTSLFSPLSRAPQSLQMQTLLDDPEYNLLELKFFVAGTVTTLNFIGTEHIKGGSNGSQMKTLKQFNAANAYKIKGKTLLVLDDYFTPLTGEKEGYLDANVFSNYPYPYKIVSRSEVYTLEKANTKGYCFLNLTMGNGKYVSVYDLSDKKPLYLWTTSLSFKTDGSEINDIISATKKHK